MLAMKTTRISHPKRHLLVVTVAALLGLGSFARAQTTVVVTGGDAGQGLTLNAGNVVTAWNVNSGGGPVTLQGVIFVDHTLGTTFTGAPPLNFGGSETSGNDLTLATMLNQGSWDGINATPLAFTFTGLTPNASYRFDLLQSLIHYGQREQAIVVNGSLVTLVQVNPFVPLNTSFVTTADGIGEIDLLVIQSGTYGGSGTQDGAVLNALVLSTVPEPATYAVLFGLGALGLVAWRRMRNLKLET
jgi:hypothetical protein